MQVLKRHLFLISVGVVTLVAVVVLLVWFSGINQDMGEWQRKFQNLMSQMETFRRSTYALDKKNVETMKGNALIAQQKVADLKRELREKYPPIPFGPTMSVLELQLFLRNKCQAICQKLSYKNVKLDPALQWFNTDGYLRPDANPDDAESKKVRKNLEIVEELVSGVACEPPVEAIVSLTRVTEGLDMKPGPDQLYDYVSYRMMVTGNITQIQGFLDALSRSGRFFIVSWMSMETVSDPAASLTPAATGGASAPAVPAGGGGGGAAFPGDGFFPGGGPGGGPGPGVAPAPGPAAAPTPGKKLPREDRLAFPNLQMIRLDVQIDYLEFKD